jgi:hypothetical protein
MHSFAVIWIHITGIVMFWSIVFKETAITGIVMFWSIVFKETVASVLSSMR